MRISTGKLHLIFILKTGRVRGTIGVVLFFRGGLCMRFQNAIGFEIEETRCCKSFLRLKEIQIKI